MNLLHQLYLKLRFVGKTQRPAYAAHCRGLTTARMNVCHVCFPPRLMNLVLVPLTKQADNAINLVQACVDLGCACPSQHHARCQRLLQAVSTGQLVIGKGGNGKKAATCHHAVLPTCPESVFGGCRSAHPGWGICFQRF